MAPVAGSQARQGIFPQGGGEVLGGSGAGIGLAEGGGEHAGDQHDDEEDQTSREWREAKPLFMDSLRLYQAVLLSEGSMLEGLRGHVISNFADLFTNACDALQALRTALNPKLPGVRSDSTGEQSSDRARRGAFYQDFSEVEESPSAVCPDGDGRSGGGHVDDNKGNTDTSSGSDFAGRGLAEGVAAGGAVGETRRDDGVGPSSSVERSTCGGEPSVPRRSRTASRANEDDRGAVISSDVLPTSGAAEPCRSRRSSFTGNSSSCLSLSHNQTSSFDPLALLVARTDQLRDDTNRGRAGEEDAPPLPLPRDALKVCCTALSALAVLGCESGSTHDSGEAAGEGDLAAFLVGSTEEPNQNTPQRQRHVSGAQGSSGKQQSTGEKGESGLSPVKEKRQRELWLPWMVGLSNLKGAVVFALSPSECMLLLTHLVRLLRASAVEEALQELALKGQLSTKTREEYTVRSIALALGSKAVLVSCLLVRALLALFPRGYTPRSCRTAGPTHSRRTVGLELTHTSDSDNKRKKLPSTTNDEGFASFNASCLSSSDRSLEGPEKCSTEDKAKETVEVEKEEDMLEKTFQELLDIVQSFCLVSSGLYSPVLDWPTEGEIMALMSQTRRTETTAREAADDRLGDCNHRRDRASVSGHSPRSPSAGVASVDASSAPVRAAEGYAEFCGSRPQLLYGLQESASSSSAPLSGTVHGGGRVGQGQSSSSSTESLASQTSQSGNPSASPCPAIPFRFSTSSQRWRDSHSVSAGGQDKGGLSLQGGDEPNEGGTTSTASPPQILRLGEIAKLCGVPESVLELDQLGSPKIVAQPVFAVEEVSVVWRWLFRVNEAWHDLADQKRSFQVEEEEEGHSDHGLIESSSASSRDTDPVFPADRLFFLMPEQQDGQMYTCETPDVRVFNFEGSSPFWSRRIAARLEESPARWALRRDFLHLLCSLAGFWPDLFTSRLLR